MGTRIFGLALALTLVACGSAQSPETQVIRQQPNQSRYEPSTFDRCPVLRTCFGVGSDYEGCPDPVAMFSSASTKIDDRSQRMLKELVHELKQVDSISKLQLTGYALKTEPPYVAAARADAVKKWLLDNGVSASLIETDTVIAAGSSGYVSFEPRQCSGSRDGGDETTPAAIFLVL